MTSTAQVFNNGASTTVIDGGARVTLSGMNHRRILYTNTCDQSLVWTTPHCDDQSLNDYNRALLGNGGNPAASATPGGGSGGAIYNDENLMELTINGSSLNYNKVNAFGSAIFFVSDNLTGSVAIADSVIFDNTGGSWYDKYPQISAQASTPITVKNSFIAN